MPRTATHVWAIYGARPPHFNTGFIFAAQLEVALAGHKSPGCTPARQLAPNQRDNTLPICPVAVWVSFTQLEAMTDVEVGDHVSRCTRHDRGS